VRHAPIPSFTYICVSIAVTLVACGAGDRPAIATLAELAGVVESQHGSEAAAWTAAARGERYHVGDAVRTSGGATATLRLGRGGELRLDPDTVVRFQKTAGDKGSLDLDVEAGAIEIEADEAPVAFTTGVGEARVERGGAVRVSAREGETRLEVLIGSVVLEDSAGVERTLGAGQELVIDVGGAIIEEEGAPPAARDAAVAAAPTTPDAAPAAASTLSVEVTGEGATVQDGETWSPLASGPVAAGSRVKVPAGTTIAVSRGGERAQVHGDAEVIVGAEGGALLRAERGNLGAEASGDSLRVVVPGGTVVLRGGDGGSAADLAVAADGDARVTVTRGQASIVTASGEEPIAAGDTAAIAAGGEVAKRATPPTHFDAVVAAGESPVIHDPRPPTAVAFGFDCDGAGTVEIAGKKGFKKPAIESTGDGTAKVLLAAGKHKYRVVCDRGGAGGSGTVTVKRDSARKELPSDPPRNVLDADGRDYTVLYQNLLPEIVLRWTDPRGKKPYQLHLVSAGKQRTMKSGEARQTLASGVLREGEHRWWFEAATGEKSQETRLTIDFDNAAAAAYIRRVESTAAGGVRVEGAAVSDSKVSVNGESVQLDQHRRFTAQVDPLPGSRACALRIAHREGGVHYYVLRTE
jgi:hypothetical protein